MKKFLLSILCLFSIVAVRAEEVTMSFADKSARISLSTEAQVWQQNGITFTNSKGSSTSNVADYGNPVRLYKSSSIEIAIEEGLTISQIVFTCNSASYATALANSITSGAAVSVSEKMVTVVPTEESNSFAVTTLSAQVRVNELPVTYASNVVSGATLSKPVASVEPGTIYNTTAVELSSESDGTIYYTTDGTEPTAESAVYSEAIAVSEFGVTTVIKAVVINGDEYSDVATYSYSLRVADPIFSIDGGVYEKVSGVTFSTDTEGATILYNNRGGDPRTEGSKTWGSLSVLSTAVVQAVAFVTNAEGDSIFSNVVKEYYTISPVKPFKVATEIVSGTKYLINYEGVIGEPHYTTTDNAYLYTENATVNGDFIETNEYYGFTITETETAGEYTIMDANNRYYYMKGTYNNFHATDDITEIGDAAIWTIAIEDDCTATITNKATGKNISYSTKYKNFESINGGANLPILYAMREYPTLTITPANWETVESITKVVVTCEDGIALNESEELYATYRDPDWNMGLDFGYGKVSEDGKSVVYELETPLTANGDYMITFPAGLFTLDPNGLAVASENESLGLTVDNPNVLELVYANPDGEGTVKSIEYLYFEFSQDIFKSVNGAVITDANGKEYPLSVTYTDSWGENTPYNALCLKTAEPITEPGTYTFVLKKEYIYAGTDVRIAEDITYTFTIVEGLKVTSISPVQGTEKSSINEIVVEFNQEVSCWAEAFYVTGPDGAEYFFTNSYDESIPYNTLRMISETPITVAGEYQIYVSEVYPMGSWSDSFSGIFTINFDGSSIVTGVDKVEAEGEKVIFDLTGRRVKEINKAGIYIINGVKTVVE